MKLTEENLFELGESLEAQASMLQAVVNYEEFLPNRSYRGAINKLYKDCLKDYNIGKLIIAELELETSEKMQERATEDSILMQNSDSEWVRLDYYELGDDLKKAVSQHQENLGNIQKLTGLERLEEGMEEFEVLAWNIPPSYDCSLEYVDLPPRERNGAEILEESHTIE